MDTCIICLDPCSDKLECCNTSVHVNCLLKSIQEGHHTCPHCRKQILCSNEVYITEFDKPTCLNVCHTMSIFLVGSALWWLLVSH